MCVCVFYVYMLYNRMMYGGNSFGGFAGFDAAPAGGFFPSPSKSGAVAVGGVSRDLQGLMAVTVKMVHEQAGEESNCMRFHHSHEASLIELVGQVESFEIDQMFFKYVIDDGTGRITCKKFVEPDKVPKPGVAVGKFVRVIGLFRRFGSDNFITAHRVEEVTHLDDIARHRIEVVHTFCVLEPPRSGAVSAASVHVSSEQSTTNPQWFLSEIQRVFGPRGPKYNPNVGVSRQALHMHFLNQLPGKLIDEKIKVLHTEGHMFSTIDDNHFQLTFS